MEIIVCVYEFCIITRIMIVMIIKNVGFKVFLHNNNDHKRRFYVLSATVVARSLQFCTMVTSIELYLFTSVLMTLTVGTFSSSQESVVSSGKLFCILTVSFVQGIGPDPVL